MAKTMAAHPILQGGLGTRNRMAALRKVARAQGGGAALDSVLDLAWAEYVKAHGADDAAAEPVKADAPAEPVKRGRGRPKGSKDSKPRKPRKSTTVKPSGKVKPSTTDTVPCVACFNQTPRVGATFYADTQSYVCPRCEAEATE